MRQKLLVVLVVMTAALAGMSARLLAVGDLAVTVTYAGKGKVDETHEILVFLFDHPVPTSESVPLAMSPVQKNGGTAAFTNVSAETVYVVMVYDEKANYDGTSGPPPQGHPIGTYSKAGKPVPVKPAAGAKVSVTFDDSRRWGQ
jgi:hypothetical protein